jgi:hypothetical protein
VSFTREEKRACLVRELRLRKKAYPRWVRAGRLRQEDAEREVAVLEAIIEDYSGETYGQGVFQL